MARDEADKEETLVIARTWRGWDSMDAVRGFAGEDLETAVLYPEDDRFLVERDLRSHHFEVVAHAPGWGLRVAGPESDG
jgi:hypothetical protein